MKDRDRYLEYPTMGIYLILSGFFIYTGNLEFIIITSLIIIIIGVILYNKFKNRKL